MKTLITGNLGYIGPAVIKHLRESYPDAVLIGFDTGYFADCLTNKDRKALFLPDIQHFGDMREFKNEMLKDVDAIVHLAAISNDPIGNINEEITLDINYRASINLAKAAKEAGVKSFVFASSCSVYGFAERKAVTEKSPINPLTAYAKSKVLTEKELEKIADSNFKVTCLRFSTACGMSERLRLDLVLNDFVASAIAEEKINILSDGTPLRPLIDINDMALAIDWAINRNNKNGGDFLILNTGSEKWNYRIKDLADEVTRAIPNTEISINKNASPDKRSYKVDFSLFKRLAPDFQPRCDIKSTVITLKNGLNEIGFNDKEFRNSLLYIRLKTLEDLKNKGMLSKSFSWIKAVR